jgi:hypothetical protein
MAIVLSLIQQYIYAEPMLSGLIALTEILHRFAQGVLLLKKEHLLNCQVA